MITFRQWLWKKFKNAINNLITDGTRIIKHIIKSTHHWGLFLITLSILVAIYNMPIFLWLFLFLSGIALIILSILYEAYKEEVNRV